MIPLILLTQSNQVTSKEKHTIDKQITKDASCSKKEIKKEAEPWRCEENRLRYEPNKQELILTESQEEELGSDLEEFLWTYDDDATYEDYPAEVQKTAEDVLSFLREKLKSLESEASESKPKSK
ncbi:hypothetical protein QL285_032603 [Trifolium repens]|nr:hypothetical protein QL285_032603 [Trifolium repens]